ncbi:hypothetical protein HY945_01320 [Candidatus Gottesmanbacteria bacterium]|nr:hypothetical protein [Candidatus Gottesmanbacteria bacterium]
MERPNPAEYQQIFEHLMMEKASIVPVVGHHLRNQEELDDIHHVFEKEMAGANAALFVGLVGSRLGGKIYLSEKRLASLFRMKTTDLRIQSMAKRLPSQLVGIQAQEYVDLSPFGIPRSDVRAATLMHDIDILTIRSGSPLQWRDIRHLNSGTTLDVLSTSVTTIVEAYLADDKESFFYRVFRDSLSLN